MIRERTYVVAWRAFLFLLAVVVVSERHASQADYEVWAASEKPADSWLRFKGPSGAARALAWRLGSADGPEGVVSVWVQDPHGTPVWAAGWKAKELIEAGWTIDANFNASPPAEQGDGRD